MDRSQELEAIQQFVSAGRSTVLEPRANPDFGRWERAQARKKVSNRAYSMFRTGRGAPPNPYRSKTRGSTG